MTTPKLELRGLSKVFGDTAAVDDIDLAIAPGETVALLGPSGCGKSTTLNMIVGLEAPTSGDILVDGVSVRDRPAQDRRIGLVFQDYAVFTHMSVRKNLAFGLAIRGRPRAEIARSVGDVAKLLGLEDVLDASPRVLGSSELQRVALGRTLVLEPALLLLDEPLSNLEADLRTAMRQQLRSLAREQGQTLIYVTHDQIEALSLADKIAVMSDGRIRQFDTAEATFQRPAHTFVASFLGNPSMNLFEGELRRDGGALLLAREGSFLPVPATLAEAAAAAHGRVVLGVRPEALHPSPDGTSFSGEVVLLEPLGAEAIATVRTGPWQMKAVLPRAHGLVEGQPLHLAFDPAHASLFDSLGGQRLGGHVH